MHVETPPTQKLQASREHERTERYERERERYIYIERERVRACVRAKRDTKITWKPVEGGLRERRWVGVETAVSVSRGKEEVLLTSMVLMLL